MKRIMVIAGGTWQVPLIKTIKSMGHYVINTNLYEDSPGFEWADIGEVANVLDKQKNLEIALKYMPDAIATDQSDIAVPTVAYVADKLGLLSIGSEVAKAFTNKYEMRKMCKKNGFASPDYVLCEDVNEAVEFWKKYRKIVIKPVDSQSSRGVHIIENQQQLEGAFEDAMQYSNSLKAVLAEQYVEGTEFTVDGIKTSEGYWVTAISKKRHFLHNPSIAQELLFSNSDKDYDYQKLREVNCRMVEKMQLPFGLTHAEYKYHEGEFYLIEIAARGGGTRISSDIVPLMSGINVNEVYINTLLGNKTSIDIDYADDRYAVLGFFDFEPGRVKKIEGLEEAAKIEGVYAIQLEFAAGDYISLALDDRSRLGYYILYGNTYEEIRQIEERIKAVITLEYFEE